LRPRRDARRPLVAGAAAFVLSLAPAPAGGAGVQSPEAALGRAHDLYAAGRWSEAEALYRSVLDVAPRSVAARHGLGNALYRQERRGAALAQWLGALRRDPGDPPVRRNVAIVRAELAASAGALDAEAVAGPLRPPLDRLSPAAAAWIVAGALVAASLALAAALLAPRARVVATVTLVLILMAAAALAAAAGLAWAARPRALVAAERAQARASPSETAAVALALPEGTALRVRETSRGWAFVSLPNGLSGWLPADEVAVIP
jgi:hypothetical protein